MTTASSIRLGLFGARADTGGLAAQTYDFYKHMKPVKTAVVVIDELTGYTSDRELYKTATYLDCPQFEPSFQQLDDFLHGLDVVFCIETPYNHQLFSLARARGIKTVLQYNFEWLAHHQDSSLPKPDLFLAPATWRIDEVRQFGPVKYLPVPVDRTLFPFKAKHKAKKFLHIAGHRTFGDRNGTAILLDALSYIESDIEIVIRTQDELPRPYTDSKLTIIRDDVQNRRDLYNDEDVLILPRKYGGLSLQLDEALSLGMPAIMLDISPQDEFLNPDWLVPGHIHEKQMIKTLIDVYGCEPEALARKIDEFAARDITADSVDADWIASQRAWEVMWPQYEALFESLCH